MEILLVTVHSRLCHPSSLERKKNRFRRSLVIDAERFNCILIGPADSKISVHRGNLFSGPFVEEAACSPYATSFQRDSAQPPWNHFQRNYVLLLCNPSYRRVTHSPNAIPVLEKFVSNHCAISISGGSLLCNQNCREDCSQC